MNPERPKPTKPTRQDEVTLADLSSNNATGERTCGSQDADGTLATDSKQVVIAGHAKRASHFPEWVQLGIMVAMFCTVAATMCQVRKSSEAIRLQAVELSNQRDFTMTIYRPYVYAAPLDSPAGIDSSSRVIGISYYVRNVGQTPAYNLRLASGLASTTSMPLVLGEQALTCLYPGEPDQVCRSRIPFFYNPVSTSAGEAISQAVGENSFYHLVVGYSDAFGNNFCFHAVYQLDLSGRMSRLEYVSAEELLNPIERQISIPAERVPGSQEAP